MAVTVDMRLAQLAGPQLGVVAAWQLHEQRIDRGAVRRRLGSGALVEILPWVYGVGPAAVHQSMEIKRMAGVLHGGPGSALALESAAERLELWNRRPRDVHVITTRHEHGRPAPWLRMHRSRTLTPRDVVEVDDIPTTTAQRTCLDLGFRGRMRPVELTYVIHQGVFRGLVSVDELEAELDARGAVPGVGVVRDAIRRYGSGSAGTRSRTEDRVHRGIERYRFPLPIVNTPGAAGVDAIEVDMVWPEHRLVLEIDGDRGHQRPDSRIRDAGRSGLVRAAGMRELRIPSSRCWDDLDGVLHELGRLLGV